MFAALKVIQRTPSIRVFLEKNDPQALAQVDAAISAEEEWESESDASLVRDRPSRRTT